MVIGSGPGGYVAAIRAAELGLKTACIEKNPTLGGTCLNVGCIPSKALLYSTEMYWKLQKEGVVHGIHASHLSANLSQMMSRKTQVISGLTKGIEGLFKKYGVDWIKGHGKLKDPTTVEVEGKSISTNSIILATGSEPIPLPSSHSTKRPSSLQPERWLSPLCPKKLLIVGAGIIGAEIGSIYNRLGSEVHCIEFLDRICPTFDFSLSKGLQKSLTAQGIVFHLSHKVVKADQTTLTVQGPSQEMQLAGDAVLVSIGRRPYSDHLGLETVGIQKDARGFIPIDA